MPAFSNVGTAVACVVVTFVLVCLSCVLFRAPSLGTAGVIYSHLFVPYHGSAPELADLIAGHVQVAFEPIQSSVGYIRGENSCHHVHRASDRPNQTLHLTRRACRLSGVHGSRCPPGR